MRLEFKRIRDDLHVAPLFPIVDTKERASFVVMVWRSGESGKNDYEVSVNNGSCSVEREWFETMDAAMAGAPGVVRTALVRVVEKSQGYLADARKRLADATRDVADCERYAATADARLAEWDGLA